MGGNSILAYCFRPAVTRGETLTRGGFSGGKFYTGDSLCYNTGIDKIIVNSLRETMSSVDKIFYNISYN